MHIGLETLEYDPAPERDPGAERYPGTGPYDTGAERTLFYLSETNSLLNSPSHRTELATATHTSQSPRFRLTVPKAGCRNGV